MKHITEALLLTSALTLGGAVALAIPRISEPPQRVNAIAPSEVRQTLTGDGQTWAIVKLWKYEFHPESVPNIDLESVLGAKSDPANSRIILESDDFHGTVTPVKGWQLIKTHNNLWQLMPVDESTENRYPEIFKRRKSS